MTNETTAIQPTTCGACGANEGERCRTMSDDRCDAGKHVSSQPKSIGDDAQFIALMNEWDQATHERSDEVFDRIAAYVHEYFRAPAAQASATIQAAPDDMPSTMEDARKLIQYLRIEIDSKVMELYDLKKKLAAPMVADPAGVAVHAKVECYFFDTEDVRLVLTDRNDKRKIRMHNDDAWFIVNAIAGAKSAATVKAVPSEALSSVEKYEVFHPDQGVWYEVSKEQWVRCNRDYRRPRDAAPLADKTGGGE